MVKMIFSLIGINRAQVQEIERVVHTHIEWMYQNIMVKQENITHIYMLLIHQAIVSEFLLMI